MKNNIIKLIVIFCIIVNFPSTLAQEQFNFSITEIEIYEKGNKFRGLKRGTITTNNGISLDADQLEYDKNLNILKAFGNVGLLYMMRLMKLKLSQITLFILETMKKFLQIQNLKQ